MCSDRELCEVINYYDKVSTRQRTASRERKSEKWSKSAGNKRSECGCTTTMSPEIVPFLPNPPIISRFGWAMSEYRARHFQC